MYGLVNQGIADLVVSVHGEQVWQQIRSLAEIDSVIFLTRDDYDDAVTYRLVEAAAEVLQTTQDEVLEAFGRHWILFTGAQGWGPTLSSAGSTVLQVLENLNDVHVRVRTTMPNATMPRFVVTLATADAIEVDYISKRDGLAPMVRGLLSGLTERLGEPHEIAQLGAKHTPEGNCHSFRLSPVEQPGNRRLG